MAGQGAGSDTDLPLLGVVPHQPGPLQRGDSERRQLRGVAFLPVVELQQPAQALVGDDGPIRVGLLHAVVGKEQGVFDVLSLMIAFVVIVVQVLPDHVPEESLADGDELAQALLFDGAHESFRNSVQVGAVRHERMRWGPLFEIEVPSMSNLPTK